jgi:hypothetical protein
VSSDGSIGGYAFGTKMKKEILTKEGIAFEGDTIKGFERKRAVLKRSA